MLTHRMGGISKWIENIKLILIVKNKIYYIYFIYQKKDVLKRFILENKLIFFHLM